LLQFINSGGHVDTLGTETNIKMSYENLKFFLGYTYTDTRLHQSHTITPTPLTPKHRINAVLMYEAAEKWKLGLETHTFSQQQLSDGSTGKAYAIAGFMAERL
jgi:outer membrane receptor for ferrienterochelin and colicins